MTKLLVVEDDPNQRRLYEQELSDEGYEIRTAAGGKEAMAQISQERPEGSWRFRSLGLRSSYP